MERKIDIKVSGAGGASFAGNAILGGAIGMGVDMANKAAYDHYPNPAYIVLEPIDPKNPKTPVYQLPAQPEKKKEKLVETSAVR